MTDAIAAGGQDTPTGFIARDPHGAAFLESIERNIERMYEEPDGPEGYVADIGTDHWPCDTITWFRDTLEILAEAWKAKEPTLGYLVAEYLRFAEPEDSYDLLELANQDAYDEALSSGHLPEEYAPKFCLQAAAWGSPHAQLWCAYCMSRGEHGYPQDLVSTQSMLDRYRTLSRPLTSLELSELDFTCHEMHSLADYSQTLDLFEDEAHSKGEEPPNPSWRSLHQRVIEIACLLLDLGRTYETEAFSYWYAWEGDFDERGMQLASLKAEWQAWCEEQGLLA